MPYLQPKITNTLWEKEITCKISTFLYSVARNKLLKLVRDEKLDVDRELVDVVEEVEEYDKYEKETVRLKKFINELGDKCRQILELFYLEGIRMDEIAKRLGYTNSANAKNQKYKCLKQLKGKFGQ